MRNVPNTLTFIRLGLIPVFVFLMHDPTQSMVYLATAIFVFAAVTDYVDGFLARKFKVVSDFGKLLDPLADKILVMAALVMLTAQRSDTYSEPWVPGWIVVLVLAREIWVTGLRGVAASRGVIVPASNMGKYKSVLQMGAIFLLLLHDHKIGLLGYRIPAQFLGLNLLVVSVAFSIWGAVEYTQEILLGAKTLGVSKGDSVSADNASVD